jgi:hypothetical protein
VSNNVKEREGLDRVCAGQDGIGVKECQLLQRAARLGAVTQGCWFESNPGEWVSLDVAMGRTCDPIESIMTGRRDRAA